MARVVINGLAGLQKKLGSLSKEVEQEVKMQVLDSATTIQLQAIGAAPAGLKGRIDSTPKDNGFAAEVGVQSSTNIPVYVEFGTGQSAAEYVPTLPKEIQEYARQFYVNGQGRMIKQPYLIPAFLRESPIFVKEVEKILKKNV